MPRLLTTTVALCLLAAVVCVSTGSVQAAEVPVLDWLQGLPFLGAGPRPDAAQYKNVALGERPAAPGAAPAQAQAADPNRLPAVHGSELSDTFTTSPLRRGLMAQRDFANNSEILRVPFEHMFNYSSPLAPNHPLPELFSELILNAVHSGVVLDSQALLALRLLMQFQQQHEWKKSPAEHASKLHWDPFLGDLPRPSSVCFYTQEELAELQIPIESPVFAARSQQLDTIAESYLAFDEMLKSKAEYSSLFPSGFSEKWYRWAYGIVLNTAIEVPIKDEDNVMGALLVLVPALNQINHANPPYHNARLEWIADPTVPDKVAPPAGSPAPTRQLPHGSGYMSLLAIKDIKAGEEITLTYGALSAIPLLVQNDTNPAHHHDSPETHTSRDKHKNATEESHFTPESFFQNIGLSNSQLLVHYGLALPSNEFERVALDIGLDGDTVGVEEHHYEVLELKRQIIDLNELDHGTLIGLDGKLDPFFIQALRTKHLTGEDLMHLSASDYEFSPHNGYLSLQNELKWQLQLVTSMENLLTAYPTSLNQDLETLRGMLTSRSAHHTNIVHSVAYRVTLKRVLHALVLRSLQNVHELFLNISGSWTEQMKQHNLEEEAQLKLHEDVTPEEKAKLLAEWQAEQATWSTQMEEWRGEMDKWEATWAQWVQATMGAKGLPQSLPKAALHPHATPETLDEMLDPSIHALQLDHEEEEVDVTDGDESESRRSRRKRRKNRGADGEEHVDSKEEDEEDSLDGDDEDDEGHEGGEDAAEGEKHDEL